MPGQASRFNGMKGGRPKGAKSQVTIEREKVMDEIRNRVSRTAQRILDAQYSIALGQQFLYKIVQFKNGQKGKPELVVQEEIIRKFLNGELDHEQNEYYYITTKEPVNQAIDSLLDRTFGKAQQSIDHTTGGEKLPTPIYNGKSTE